MFPRKPLGMLRWKENPEDDRARVQVFLHGDSVGAGYVVPALGNSAHGDQSLGAESVLDGHRNPVEGTFQFTMSQSPV